MSEPKVTREEIEALADSATAIAKRLNFQVGMLGYMWLDEHARALRARAAHLDGGPLGFIGCRAEEMIQQARQSAIDAVAAFAYAKPESGRNIPIYAHPPSQPAVADELRRLRDALIEAREYVAGTLAEERAKVLGHEYCGKMQSIKRELAAIDAALGAKP